MGGITPGDGQLISAPSSLSHHLPPWGIQGMAPAGGQDSAKFPLMDSTAANPRDAGTVRTRRAPSPAAANPGLGGFGESRCHCRALSEPHRDGESPVCPSRAAPGAPQHLHLVRTAPGAPQLHKNHTNPSCPCVSSC